MVTIFLVHLVDFLNNILVPLKQRFAGCKNSRLRLALELGLGCLGLGLRWRLGGG